MKIVLPSISVVIPTRWRAGAELTRNCIGTLVQHHGHLRGIEIIVVHDGDDPEGVSETRKVVEDYCGVAETKFLVNSRPGFAAACNLGIEYSSGMIVFLVNNDIEFIEPALQYLAAFAFATGASVVAPALIYPNSTTQHAGVVYVKPDGHEMGWFDHRARGEDYLSPSVVWIGPSLVTGALFGINRWAIEVIGLLDERFGFTCEDIDYCLRCYEAGSPSVYVGTTRAIHHEGATRGATPEQKAARAPQIAELEMEALARLHRKWKGVNLNVFK